MLTDQSDLIVIAKVQEVADLIRPISKLREELELVEVMREGLEKKTFLNNPINCIVDQHEIQIIMSFKCVFNVNLDFAGLR